MGPTTTLTPDAVWREFRLAENAFRYYGDVMLGVIAAYEKQGTSSKLHVKPRPELLAGSSAANPGARGNWPWPCIPGFPCEVKIDTVRTSLQQTAVYLDWLVQTGLSTLDALKQAGVTVIESRPTQLPEFPKHVGASTAVGS